MKVILTSTGMSGRSEYCVVEYSDEDRMPDSPRIELRKRFVRVVGNYWSRAAAEAAAYDKGM